MAGWVGGHVTAKNICCCFISWFYIIYA